MDGLPPHDVSAEEAVIAALLLDEAAISRVQPILSAADFFREQHQWCYEAAVALADRSEPITIPVLAHELDRAGRLDAMGGEAALVEIVGRHFAAEGVEAHARIVARDARYRRLIQVAGQIGKLGYEGGPDAASVLAASLGLLGGLLTEEDTGLERLGHADLAEHEGAEWGVPALDRYTMGAAPGQLTIVAGSSGEGKSMFAAQIARNVAASGGRVAIFTMEMANREYEARMAHAVSAVRKRYSRYDAPLSGAERAALLVGQAQVAAWDIHSSAKANITAASVVAAVRLLGAERHVDLVVVDYLQLMGVPDNRENEASNLKQITKTLKNLSMEAGCHVLLVSQLNRASLTEMRTGGTKLECPITNEKYPRPFKEALMGGAVENDADLVVMLQRHPCKPGWREPAGQHMQVVIAKNRNGRDGDCMMWADFGTCRFMALSEQECYNVAGASLQMTDALLYDQGHRREDRHAAMAAPRVVPHNAYEFDPATEALLNMAAALDPAQARAQTLGPVERLRSPDETSGREWLQS